MTTPGPSPAPPGWYPGPTGVPQWWDGRGWGPTAPPAADTSTTFALFAHLGTLLAGFLVPLILLLTEGKKNRFVKHHATEALNWAITVAMVSVVIGVLYVVAFVVGFATTTPDGDPAHAGAFVVIVLVVVVLWVALAVTSLVFTILGAVRASQRRWWRYPVAVRFVRGAATRAQIAALEHGTH